jgi:hypothetical protein
VSSGPVTEIRGPWPFLGSNADRAAQRAAEIHADAIARRDAALDAAARQAQSEGGKLGARTKLANAKRIDGKNTNAGSGRPPKRGSVIACVFELLEIVRTAGDAGATRHAFKGIATKNSIVKWTRDLVAAGVIEIEAQAVPRNGGAQYVYRIAPAWRNEGWKSCGKCKRGA